MALLGEPEQIEAFAAKWDKDPVFHGQPEIWPKFDKKWIHCQLVKGDLIVAPGLLPKFVVTPGHGGFFPSNAALLNQENVLIERHNASQVVCFVIGETDHEKSHAGRKGTRAVGTIYLPGDN
ncbi:MAG: hypothetical protein WA049_11215 [Ferribacterium limneticum]